MFVILSVSTGPKEKGVLAGVAVGSVVALEALFAGPISAALHESGTFPGSGSCFAHWITLDLYGRPGVLAPCQRAACRCVQERLLLPCNYRGDLFVKKIVFVCVENSNRSQMAEAFARIHGAGKSKPFSAGSRPSGRVNPQGHRRHAGSRLRPDQPHSKGLDRFNGKDVEAAVTMGCGDECPLVLAKLVLCLGRYLIRRKCPRTNFGKCGI